MNLSAISMRYSTVVYTLVVLMTAWGVYTFLTMPRREDPEFTIRTCVVGTRWPGTPAVKVEELITDKLEEELDSIEEIEYLNSETTIGQSVIYVHLEDNVPPERLRQLVASRNIVSPGGSIDTRDGKFNVKPGGEFDAITEIESVSVGAVQSGESFNQVS